MRRSRMHYPAPRILDGAGLLSRLFTDFSARAAFERYLRWVPQSCQPAVLRRARARIAKGVSPQKITSLTTLGIVYALRRRFPGQRLGTRTFLSTNREFC